MANYVKFICGDLTEENLQKVKERGAVPGKVFIGDTGELFVLRDEEGFRKSDLKIFDLETPLVYDLEARVKEINGQKKEALKDSRAQVLNRDWVFYGDSCYD